MRIGVISDTHDFLDERVLEFFQGVEHILHGGDVGMPWLILKLEEIAPVTAVIGNTDLGLQLRETEVSELDGRKFLVHHIVNPDAPHETIARRIAREKPDVVVFGHTHKPFQERINGTLYLNPGYAGKTRFALPRSVAILETTNGDLRVEFKLL
ncbi:MAG: metallophosphatase family protein [Verrucomicrobia subdivision 3 bacterium]|nr:metallophosphatase family protein [Limisphaerales bacterium]